MRVKEWGEVVSAQVIADADQSYGVHIAKHRLASAVVARAHEVLRILEEGEQWARWRARRRSAAVFRICDTDAGRRRTFAVEEALGDINRTNCRRAKH